MGVALQKKQQALVYEKQGPATIACLVTKFRGYRRVITPCSCIDFADYPPSRHVVVYNDYSFKKNKKPQRNSRKCSNAKKYEKG